MNPLRYRGYIYEPNVGLYYLQSRYYCQWIGRFISPDAYIATGQGILGNNMFAYCGNSPINYADYSGYARVGILTGPPDTRVLGYGGGGASSGSITLYLLYLFVDIFVRPSQRSITNQALEKEEGAKQKQEQIYAQMQAPPSSNAVYYGVDLYGGTRNVITGPMGFSAAAAWAVATAASGKYSDRASWGLYTRDFDDALAMALYLSPIGPVALDPAKGNHLPHFHTSYREIQGTYAKGFHIWFG